MNAPARSFTRIGLPLRERREPEVHASGVQSTAERKRRDSQRCYASFFQLSGDKKILGPSLRLFIQSVSYCMKTFSYNELLYCKDFLNHHQHCKFRDPAGSSSGPQPQTRRKSGFSGVLIQNHEKDECFQGFRGGIFPPDARRGPAVK